MQLGVLSYSQFITDFRDGVKHNLKDYTIHQLNELYAKNTSSICCSYFDVFDENEIKEAISYLNEKKNGSQNMEIEHKKNIIFLQIDLIELMLKEFKNDDKIDFTCICNTCPTCSSIYKNCPDPRLTEISLLEKIPLLKTALDNGSLNKDHEFDWKRHIRLTKTLEIIRDQNNNILSDKKNPNADVVCIATPILQNKNHDFVLFLEKKNLYFKIIEYIFVTAILIPLLKKDHITDNEYLFIDGNLWGNYYIDEQYQIKIIEVLKQSLLKSSASKYYKQIFICFPKKLSNSLFEKITKDF